MAPSEAQKRATAKWQKERVEAISFRVPKGEKARIHAHTAALGVSTNAYIYHAVCEAIERDLEKVK